MAKTKKTTPATTQATVARSSDGGIQITFTIPLGLITKAKDEAIDHLGESVTVPGFRKGKAPKDKVKERLNDEELTNHALGHILPEAFAKAVKANNLRPAIYPKFELVTAKPDEAWQIRAITCELPKIKLGGYKKTIAGAVRASKLWKPGDDTKKQEPPTQAEKEQQIIKTIVDEFEVDIPTMLLDEEVNTRLARLLEKIERLGLTLEGYLSSIGKTNKSLREEYEKQAQEGIKLELVLNEIAIKEGIKVEAKEVAEAVAASGAKEANEDQKRMIHSIIARRKTLEKLASVV